MKTLYMTGCLPVEITAADIEKAKRSDRELSRFLKSLDYLVWFEIETVMDRGRIDNWPDCYQHVMLRLIPAIQKFDAARVVKVDASYLISIMRNAIKGFMIDIHRAGFKACHQQIEHKSEIRIDENGRAAQYYKAKDGRWLKQRQVETWTEIEDDWSDTPLWNTASLSRTVAFDENEGRLTNEDIIPSHEFKDLDAEEKYDESEKCFLRFIKRLSNRDYRVVKMYYGLGMPPSYKRPSVRELARRFKMSHNGIHKIIKRARIAFGKRERQKMIAAFAV